MLNAELTHIYSPYTFIPQYKKKSRRQKTALPGFKGQLEQLFPSIL